MAYPLSPCDLGSEEFMSKSPSHLPPVPGAQQVIFSATALSKGKRSKRCRLHDSSSEAEPELPIPKSQGLSSHAAFSSDLSEEELEQQEVAARCLLMMSTFRSASPTTSESRGDLVASSVPEPPRRRIKKPRKFDYLDDAENHTAAAAAAAAAAAGNGPVRVYECKSCGKGFLSFQALGGHRATCQNKLRAAINEAAGSGSDFFSVEEMKKAKTHECPVCHRIFPSGQALGGHRRTHSTPAATATATTTAETAATTSLSGTEQLPSSSSRPSATKMMELDLNIPASAEDDSGVSDYLDAQTADRRPFRPWWADEDDHDDADSELESNRGFRSRAGTAPDLSSKPSMLLMAAVI